MGEKIFAVQIAGVILAIAALAGATAPPEWPASGSDPIFQEMASKQADAKTRSKAQEWFAKGQEALQSGDLEIAEDAFRNVIAVDPLAGAAYSNLGVIAM